MLLRPMRKYATAGFGSAVLAAGLTFVAPPAQAAVPASVADVSTWLAAQLTDGIVHNDQWGFDDYGLSIDISLAMSYTNSDDTDAAAIRDAVASHIASYTHGGSDDPSALYADPIAKAAYLAGASADNFGGENLLDELVSVVNGDGAILDTNSVYGGYGNTIGQAFAARALSGAGGSYATAASKVTDFLLAQQCPGGGFALNGGQTSSQCTSDADADPDVTAYFLILNVGASQSDARLARAVGKAETWLMNRQHADGSFNGGASTDSPNANSTGLAGWALGALGDVDARTAAAVWIRRHQVQALPSCPSQLDSQAGAIAYDDLALTKGRLSGITTSTAGQWRSASSQALPALMFAPTTTSTPSLTAPTAYVAAGSTATVHASGITPGTWVCGSVGGSHVPGSAGLAGTAALKVKVPAGTGHRTVTLTASDGTSATAIVKALAAKALPVVVTKTAVRAGGKQTVKVSGLAPGEPVKVIYGGKVISGAAAKASSSGTYALTFAVGSATGSRTVTIRGAFADRTGSKTFKVS